MSFEGSRIGSKLHESASQATSKDFIFFDAGMVIFDLDWDLFEERIAALFQPKCFDRRNFFSALTESLLLHKWERGMIGPHEFANGFRNCLEMAQKTPGSLKVEQVNVCEIKEISNCIIGAPRSGVIELASKLRENGYFTGILSNATPWHEADILEKADIRKKFDLVLFSQDLGCAKPEEKIYQLAEELAKKVVATKCALQKEDFHLRFHFVDDTPANVRAALAQGWQARLIDTLKDAEMWHSSELETLSQRKQNLTFGIEATNRIEKLLGCFLPGTTVEAQQAADSNKQNNDWVASRGNFSSD